MIKKNIKSDLFILSDMNEIPDWIDRLNNKKKKIAKLIVLSDDIELINGLECKLKKIYPVVKIYKVAGKLEKIAYKVRKRLISLVSKAKDISINKRKLLFFLTYENRFSLWWTTEIFHKRSYKFKTFTYLCQIEFIIDFLRKNKVQDAYILSSRPFHSVISSLLKDKGISVETRNNDLNIYLSHLFLAIKYSFIFLKWFLGFLFITSICKLFVIQEKQKGKIAFIQFYTAYWPKQGSAKDDKFGENNSIIKKFKQKDVISLCTLFPDGIHPSISPWNIFKILRKKKSNLFERKRLFLLEKYISYSKILYLFFYSFYIIFKLSKLSINKNFINHWKYKNIDIYPLIKLELLQSMRRMPRFIFYIERIKYFIKEFYPKGVVYNMFETPIGKSIAYAIKSQDLKIKSIATQDGPICRLKLETANSSNEFSKNIDSKDYLNYFPIPDEILLEGNYAKNVLLESGYPKSILHVCGSARMMGLNKVSKKRPSFSKKIKFLVAIGQNDGFSLINFCAEVQKRNKNCFFIFKLHPRGNINKTALLEYLKSTKFNNNYEITALPVWHLFKISNYIIGTFTSVLDEAAVKGFRVISILFNSRINTSPLIDLKPHWVDFVSTVDQFLKIIETKKTKKVNEHDLKKFENHLYYKTDSSPYFFWKKRIEKLV